MAVRIGSAKGSYGNTSAGDQNGGKEVSRENWYAHSKGWVLLRAKDAAVRERIAVGMEHACDNNDIGYHQGTRDTLYNNVKGAGFDPAKTTRKVNTDCSALVRVCVNYAGISVGNFNTESEINALMNTGAFVKYTDADHCKSSARLLRGDILVTKVKGHTVVVLSDGAKASGEAELAAKPVESVKGTGKLVEVTGGTVNIRIGAGKKHKSVGTAKKGERYELVCEMNGFVPIIVGGDVRWISKDYVREVQ